MTLIAVLHILALCTPTCHGFIAGAHSARRSFAACLLLEVSFLRCLMLHLSCEAVIGRGSCLPVRLKKEV